MDIDSSSNISAVVDKLTEYVDNKIDATNSSVNGRFNNVEKSIEDAVSDFNVAIESLDSSINDINDLVLDLSTNTTERFENVSGLLSDLSE